MQFMNLIRYLLNCLFILSASQVITKIFKREFLFINRKDFQVGLIQKQPVGIIL